MQGRGGLLLVLLALAAAVGLVGSFVAAGGAERLQTQPAVAGQASDACSAAALPVAAGAALEAEASRILLVSLTGAACTLKVPREDLVLALGRGSSVAAAAATLGVGTTQLEDAVFGAIEQSVASEEQAGRVTPTTALAIRTLVDIVPADRLLAAVQGSGDACGSLPWKPVDGLSAVAAEIGVKTGLRTACALQVAPLEAIAALADPAGLAGLATRSGRSPAEVERAVRTAIGASIAEAAAAGALSGTEGSVLGAAARVAPVDRLLAIVRGDDDPCAPFPWPGSTSQSEALAAVAMIGVVDAACHLGVPTFDAFAALADQAELDRLLAASGKTQADVETALRSGLGTGLSTGQDAGAISGLEALLLRGVLSQVGILDLLRNFVG